VLVDRWLNSSFGVSGCSHSVGKDGAVSDRLAKLTGRRTTGKFQGNYHPDPLVDGTWCFNLGIGGCFMLFYSDFLLLKISSLRVLLITRQYKTLWFYAIASAQNGSTNVPVTPVCFIPCHSSPFGVWYDIPPVHHQRRSEGSKSFRPWSSCDSWLSLRVALLWWHVVTDKRKD